MTQTHRGSSQSLEGISLPVPPAGASDTDPLTVVTMPAVQPPRPSGPANQIEELGLARASRPKIMIAMLVGSDLAMLALAAVTVLLVRLWLGGQYTLETYFRLWPILALFIVAYAGVRLYPGVPLSPPEELRRLTLINVLMFFGIGTLTFLVKEGQTYSRAVLFGAMALSVVLVPVGRAILRTLFAAKPWWGYPVVVIGNRQHAMKVISLLKREPSIGLKPVAVLNSGEEGQSDDVLGVPMVGSFAQVDRLARQHRIRYAIVMFSTLPERRVERVMNRFAKTFHHLMVIQDLPGLSSLWVSPVDLQGVLGLEVRHRLLDRGHRIFKRVLDLVLVIAAAPFLGLALLLIGLAVRLDSPGPIFYGHMRIGRRCQRFTAWKFRTMVPDADRVLDDYLQRHPELRAEWERDHKLKDDPRVTRVGRWLRKTSLDELPQVWNVLEGKMSLVGPRPIVDEEVCRYQDSYELYKQVHPGITGVWQVSGRNLVSYEERVEMDVYYVRNWSIWLDMYLLVRTTAAVLAGHGAY